MKNTRLVLVLVLFVLIFSFVPQEAIAQNSVQVCGPSAEVSTLLTKITTVSVDKLIRVFSGANQVMIDGVKHATPRSSFPPILMPRHTIIFTRNC